MPRVKHEVSNYNERVGSVASASLRVLVCPLHPIPNSPPSHRRLKFPDRGCSIWGVHVLLGKSDGRRAPDPLSIFRGGGLFLRPGFRPAFLRHFPAGKIRRQFLKPLCRSVCKIRFILLCRFWVSGRRPLGILTWRSGPDPKSPSKISLRR
jgi:hypothetical protein